MLAEIGFWMALVGLLGGLAALAYGVRAYHIARSPGKMAERLQDFGYTAVDTRAVEAWTSAVEGVRHMTPFKQGEKLAYGGDYCDIRRIDEDGCGGIQITMQKWRVRL